MWIYARGSTVKGKMFSLIGGESIINGKQRHLLYCKTPINYFSSDLLCSDPYKVFHFFFFSRVERQREICTAGEQLLRKKGWNMSALAMKEQTGPEWAAIRGWGSLKSPTHGICFLVVTTCRNDAKLTLEPRWVQFVRAVSPFFVRQSPYFKFKSNLIFELAPHSCIVNSCSWEKPAEIHSVRGLTLSCSLIFLSKHAKEIIISTHGRYQVKKSSKGACLSEISDNFHAKVQNITCTSAAPSIFNA